jgi:peroxiredoxin Q/BCP
MTIAVGAVAPDFSLEGTDGTGRDDGRRTYSLSEFKGMVVVLVFYPADSSPVCTVQLQTYTDDIAQFDDVGAQVMAISPQSVDEHERFAADNGGFGFPLLADLQHEAAEAYGVLGPMGFYRRSVFVIDADGLVSYAHRSTAGLTFRPTEELIDAVRAASTTSA